MNNKELYKLLQTVQKNIRCPQCGKEYGFSEIKIRGIMDTIVFLELNCAGHMPVLATVTLTKSQMESKAKNNQKVGNNDVLETFKILKNFKGGFDKLFNNPISNKKQEQND
jgi:hypothetical protein